MEAETKKDYLVDCVMQSGELDESGYHFKSNELYCVEVVKHNVPHSEFLRWINSDERWNKQRALEEKARERWGEEFWMHYEVCCFCTLPAKD